MHFSEKRGDSLLPLDFPHLPKHVPGPWTFAFIGPVKQTKPETGARRGVFAMIAVKWPIFRAKLNVPKAALVGRKEGLESNLLAPSHLLRRTETTTGNLTSSSLLRRRTFNKKSKCVSHTYTSVNIAVMFHFQKHFHRRNIYICEC